MPTEDLRRHAKRYECQARFSGAGAAAMHVRGEVQDLSLEGLCLKTNLQVKVGQTLHLDFVIPTGRIEVVGEVRWVKRAQGEESIGIRFIRISEEVAKAISEATKETPEEPLTSEISKNYVFR